MSTSIEWVTLGDGKPGLTVNPIRARDKRTKRVGHFCERVSPGCAHCYASTWQRRLKMHAYEPKFRKRVEFFLDTNVLVSVLKRKQPTAYFWEDMSDLFGRWVKEDWLDACFATMAATPRHLHMVLTKRPATMRQYFAGLAKLSPLSRVERWVTRSLLPPDALGGIGLATLPINRVMLGTSYENQETANARLPELLRTPAWQRFVSFEPALGPVTLRWAACTCANKNLAFSAQHERLCPLAGVDLCKLLHRVIVGGESGAGARPFYLQWARSTIRQCHDLRVPVFVKQLGSFPTTTPVGTEEFKKHPVKVIKLKLHSYKGNDPAEWDAEYRVRE